MSRPLTIAALIAATAATSGCASMRQAMGAEKVAPDEFRIVTRAPLVLPPDYALRPPRPGEPRPQELGAVDEARMALFGQDLGQNASAGERVFVARAGAETAPSAIRDTVDFEGAAIVHRSQELADGVIGFGATQGADAESADLADQEAVRRVTGGAAVVIERRDGGRVKLPGA